MVLSISQACGKSSITDDGFLRDRQPDASVVEVLQQFTP